MNQQTMSTVIWFHSLALYLPISIILLYKWPQLWHYLLALFLGIVTFIIDLGTDEVQFPALLLLVSGFFLGFNQPKNSWRLSLMLSVWIPIFGIAKILLTQEFSKLGSEGFGAFLALVPAFIGTYAGVFLHATIVRKQKVSETTVNT